MIKSGHGLINNPKLDFSREVHRCNNCSRKNLNKIAVATGEEIQISRRYQQLLPNYQKQENQF